MTETIYNAIRDDWNNLQLSRIFNPQNFDFIHRYNESMSASAEDSLIANVLPIIKNQFDAFDKAIPDRWISKDDKQKIWKSEIVMIKNYELNYSREWVNYRRNFELSEISRSAKLINEKFTKEIYKGIKIDIRVIEQISNGTSKLSTFGSEITNKLKENKINDIVNFTGIHKNLIVEKIELRENLNRAYFQAKCENNEIGFWKGNFFGSEETKEQYLNNKNIMKDAKNNINNIYHFFKDAVIEKNHLSPLDNTNGCKTNFGAANFKDGAILRGRIENKILTHTANDAPFAVIPGFLLNKEFDRHHLASKMTSAELTEENATIERNFLNNQMFNPSLATGNNNDYYGVLYAEEQLQQSIDNDVADNQLTPYIQ